MNTKKTVSSIALNIVVWFFSLIMFIPFLFMVVSSLMTSREAARMTIAIPESLQWENFSVVIERGNLAITFLNSTLYSVASVFLVMILASMSAYVLSRNRTKLHNFLYFFIVLGITMPINFVTLIRVMQVLHLMNSRIGLILLYTAVQMPFNVFLLYAFIGRIPNDVDEAAIIDGCKPMQLFFYVIFPLLKPVLVTVMVLTFLNTWNEFILPLYVLGSSTLWPMTLAVYNFFGMFFRDWNLISANLLLTSLPVILVYLFGQKHIVAGMTAGAVKG